MYQVIKYPSKEIVFSGEEYTQAKVYLAELETLYGKMGEKIERTESILTVKSEYGETIYSIEYERSI